jgi:hypothetical protein
VGSLSGLKPAQRERLTLALSRGPLQQRAGIDVQRLRQFADNVDSGAVPRTFQRADVTAINASLIGQRFLRRTARVSLLRRLRAKTSRISMFERRARCRVFTTEYTLQSSIDRDDVLVCRKVAPRVLVCDAQPRGETVGYQTVWT